MYNGYLKPLGPRHAAWLIYANRIEPDPASVLEVAHEIFGSDDIQDWFGSPTPTRQQKSFSTLNRRMYRITTYKARHEALKWIASYMKGAGDPAETLVQTWSTYPDFWSSDSEVYCPKVAALLHDSATRFRWGQAMATFWSNMESSLNVAAIPSILALAGVLEQTRSMMDRPEFFRAELPDILTLQLQSVAILRRYVTADTLEMRVAFLSKALVALEKCDTTLRERQFGLENLFLNRILLIWKRCAQAELDSLQGTAQLKLTFETRQVVREKRTTLAAVLENEGRGYAENVTITLDPGLGYTPAATPVTPTFIDLLASNASQKVRFEIASGPADEFVVAVTLDYEDVGGKRSQTFKEKIGIIEETRRFADFYNPYEKGKPIRDRGSRIFFGREDVFADIARILDVDTQHFSGKSIVLLVGERRMGKTSVLLQLDYQLPSKYIPVFLDLQGFDDEGNAAFLYWLGISLARVLKTKGFATELPPLAVLREAPTTLFSEFLLNSVLPAIGEHHIVLLFDEFEHLQDLIHDKRQTDGILLFLRDLMQHTPRLSFVFAGTQRLQEMASEYQSIMFNIAHTIPLRALSRENSDRLVIEPVEGMLEYESGAPDFIYQLTRGHPFFTQLLCYEIVERQKRNQKSYTTLTDVEDAARAVVETGQSHFDYIFDTLTELERLVLSGMSAWSGTQSLLLVSDIVSNLNRYRVPISLLEARNLLDKLVQRGVLMQVSRYGSSERGGEYIFSMDLVRRWLVRHRSFEQVLDEYLMRQSPRPTSS